MKISATLFFLFWKHTHYSRNICSTFFNRALFNPVMLLTRDQVWRGTCPLESPWLHILLLALEVTELLQNWHENANDTRIKQRMRLFLIGQKVPFGSESLSDFRKNQKKQIFRPSPQKNEKITEKYVWNRHSALAVSNFIGEWATVNVYASICLNVFIKENIDQLKQGKYRLQRLYSLRRQI